MWENNVRIYCEKKMWEKIGIEKMWENFSTGFIFSNLLKAIASKNIDFPSYIHN